MRSSSRSTRARRRSSGSSSRGSFSNRTREQIHIEPAEAVARLAGLPGRAAKPPRYRRRRRARVRLLWQWSLLAVSLLVLSGVALGLAFAGSSERLPEGTRIAGVEVAGLTPGDA